MMKSICKRLSKKHKGQGVVEYAGAVVVAAVIVGAVIQNGAPAISTMFKTVADNISSKLTAQATSAIK